MREVPAWPGPFDADALPSELLAAERPYVVRGGFGHWPVVQAARESDLALARYLMGFYNGVRVALFELAPEADRKSTRLNSSHYQPSRMPSSA